jgi:hypothetical protein
MPLIFTTAPEIYDLPGTVPAGHAGFTREGAVLRAVRVDLPGAVTQVQRYLTAGYMACGETGLDQIRQDGGFIEYRSVDDASGHLWGLVRE